MSQISVKSGRKYLSPQEKLNVVMESFNQNITLNEICEKYGVHLTQLNKWRKQFKEEAASIFTDKRIPRNKNRMFPAGQSPDDLKKIIGELTVQNEILKKVQGLLG